ncbi:RNA 2'-O-ribose methyltransferase mtfA [Klebsiella pneumoniae]|uniref:RNA 2'-O-ribose methyltransferase mtfA n=1 Tax=Klebsiella pneumoniae TaxID=573 RepID=A0A2X3HCB3_KLEPN|nr:RNA 2'-O-ribose methyltransferase mtfA [Klebsiella pneumoniae]
MTVFGFARVKEDSGYVIFEGYQQDDGEKLVRDLPFSSLIFARQMFVVGELLRRPAAGGSHNPDRRHAAGHGGERVASCVWKWRIPTKAKS